MIKTAWQVNQNRTNGNKANESNGVGVGTTSYWDPKGRGKASGESILIHELQHAVYKNSGKIQKR